MGGTEQPLCSAVEHIPYRHSMNPPTDHNSTAARHKNVDKRYEGVTLDHPTLTLDFVKWFASIIQLILYPLLSLLVSRMHRQH